MEKGITTMYQGIRFRSRLEAKWAAFFDQLRWRWEYEPRDFNGWIPDFALLGKDAITCVEVKPIIKFPQEVADKIDASGCKEEVLIVGLTPLMPGIEGIGTGHLGWLRDTKPVGWGCGWGEASFIRCNRKEGDRWIWGTSGPIGFCHAIHSYRDRISGEASGDHHIGQLLWEEIPPLWSEACNQAQWRAPA